jgi:hypothetical protein
VTKNGGDGWEVTKKLRRRLGSDKKIEATIGEIEPQDDSETGDVLCAKSRLKKLCLGIN